MALEWWLDRHDERTAWTAKAATQLEERIPYGGHERKEVWMTYLSHAMHAAGPDSILHDTIIASLLERVGRVPIDVRTLFSGRGDASAITVKTTLQLLV